MVDRQTGTLDLIMSPFALPAELTIQLTFDWVGKARTSTYGATVRRLPTELPPFLIPHEMQLNYYRIRKDASEKRSASNLIFLETAGATGFANKMRRRTSFSAGDFMHYTSRYSGMAVVRCQETAISPLKAADWVRNREP